MSLAGSEPSEEQLSKLAAIGQPGPLHLALPQLMQQHLDLGDALGRAYTGNKLMTLVASPPWPAATAPAGRPALPGYVLKATSTLGTFLPSSRQTSPFRKVGLY